MVSKQQHYYYYFVISSLLVLLLGGGGGGGCHALFFGGRNNNNNDQNKQKKTTSCSSPCVPGDESSIMRPKEHGTSHTPVQSDLRWGCDVQLADRICNFNRHYAEHSGYWLTTTFLSSIDTTRDDRPITFYDSNTGKPLFKAPVGRSWQEFLDESRHHGWFSFRDAEVNWKYVRVLNNGETVSVDGTHLGHNLPDAKGRRYCINLVSVAGNPVESAGRRDLL